MMFHNILINGFHDFLTANDKRLRRSLKKKYEQEGLRVGFQTELAALDQALFKEIDIHNPRQADQSFF